MVFNQSRCLENVYRLLQERSITISQFEEHTLGVSKGYLSRLRNGNSPDAPGISLSLLFKLTEALDVSVEYLLVDPYENETDTSRLLSFLDAILVDSTEGTMDWDTGTVDWFSNSSAETSDGGYIDYIDLSKQHPIIKVTDVWDEDGISLEGRVSISDWHFGAVENPKDNIRVNVVDFCSSEVPSTNAVLFLYRVEYSRKLGDRDDLSGVEAYLLFKDNHRSFLADTAYSSKEIASILKNLYQAGKSIANQRRLDSKARNLLQQFTEQRARKEVNSDGK